MQKKLDEIEAKRRSEASAVEAAEKRLRKQTEMSKSKPGKLPSDEVVPHAAKPLATIVMAKKQ